MKRLALLALGALCVLPAFSTTALIVYDGPPGRSEAFKSATFIRQLLGHFETDTVDLLPARDYRPVAAASGAVVFVVFEEDALELAPAGLEELAAFSGKIVWLNMHIGRLLNARPEKYGFVHEGYAESPAWKVLCRGIDFAKDDPWLNVVRVPRGQSVGVLAEAADETGRRFPYLLRSGNLWYFADSPFAFAVEGGRYLILAELLHQILDQWHPPELRAMVRIEDVNPESDPESLRKVADYLGRQGVPFQVSLIPIYRDPASQKEIPLSERPAVVRAIGHMVSRGGTIVLHGATHQHRGVSGDDYEFWDDIAGTPIGGLDEDRTGERVRRAIDECFRCGIHPLAWETPHYSASAADYRAFARYFDTFNDRVMSAELAGTQQPFPYPVRLRDYDVKIVPENLGYLDVRSPDPASILKAARRLAFVRDGLGSFFFHPFVPLKHLAAVVRGMKNEGWTFVSLRDFPCQLRTPSQWVTSAGGEGEIELANQYLHTLRLDRKGKTVSEEFSPGRITGTEARRPALGRGELFVLEGLDVLPAPRKEGLGSRLTRLVGLGAERGRRDNVLRLSRTLVLTGSGAAAGDEFGQRSFQSVLRVFGLNPDSREAKAAARQDLGRYHLVVVPRSAARVLDRPEINSLWDYVSGGGFLVVDGPSPLAELLGLRFETPAVNVRQVKEMTLPAPVLSWNPAAPLNPLAGEGLQPLARDVTTGAVVAAVKPLGRGRVLALAASFDPYTPFGISRYPYFSVYLRDALGLPFNVRRNALEFYFDPGLRQNASWEKLVARWQASGVKIIYLAAWHFYESYEFDYAHFIRLCHRHGIAVYAWFEFPQVTPLFWDRHPEWREKTATGRDALCHWRLQMNLANGGARAAALSFFRELLNAHDWDGVNLAELNFDTNQGAEDPDKFTPMNGDVRRSFREEAGFDPLELFSPASPRYWKKDPAAWTSFLRYRGRLVRDLHRIFLDEVESLKRAKRKDLDIIVTAMDSLVHPEIFEDCGIDIRDIIGLMDRYPFTLQVEDPSRSWTGSPDRYREYHEVYKPLVGDDSRLMFDVNCLANRDIRRTSLPSALATGTELATTVFYAAQASGRVGIYAESTLQPFDIDQLAFVLAADVSVSGSGAAYEVRSGRPFTLALPAPGALPYIRGEPWPFVGARGLSAPAGSYRLEFRKGGLLDHPALSWQIALDGDISGLERTANSYRLEYRSPLPVSLSANRTPAGIQLDGSDINLSPDQAGTVLPRGRHSLEIVTEKAPARTVRVAGYLTSSAFYLLGLASTLLLMGVYVISRFNR